MRKILFTLLFLFLFLAAFVNPVFAHGLYQDGTPPTTTPFDWAVVGQWAVGVALTIIIAYAVSLGAERGTEVVKMAVRLLAKLPMLSKLEPTGQVSSILALLVAGLGVFGFNLDIFSELPLFANVDPELVKILGTLIVWVLSSKWHESGQLPSPKGSPPAASA